MVNSTACGILYECLRDTFIFLSFPEHIQRQPAYMPVAGLFMRSKRFTKRRTQVMKRMRIVFLLNLKDF